MHREIKVKNKMTVKPYKTKEQPMPKASEQAAVYEHTALAHESHPIGGKRKRMSVDEYFDELWSRYLTKRSYFPT